MSLEQVEKRRRECRTMKTGTLIAYLIESMLKQSFSGYPFAKLYAENAVHELNSRFAAHDAKHFEHVQSDIEEYEKAKRT